MTTTPKSPCIQVCALDSETTWCLGCGRTLKEIGGWLKMEDAQKLAVLDQLPGRKNHLRELGKLGPFS